MTMTIRPLQASDRAAWQDLWRSYLEFYESSVADEVTETTWRRMLVEGEDPSGFCAVDEKGELIGIVHYLFHRSCWSVDEYCYLQDLFVAPDQRRAGAGEALIGAVSDAAARRGASQVYWLTQHFNETARRLYDRVGELTPFIKYKLGS
jgi:GNAT superfamily N-acetyltransferase